MWLFFAGCQRETIDIQLACGDLQCSHGLWSLCRAEFSVTDLIPNLWSTVSLPIIFLWFVQFSSHHVFPCIDVPQCVCRKVGLFSLLCAGWFLWGVCHPQIDRPAHTYGAVWSILVYRDWLIYQVVTISLIIIYIGMDAVCLVVHCLLFANFAQLVYILMI